MPLERFAQESGVAGSTVRYHARRGLIDRAPDGSVDPAQAREWLAQHEARIAGRAEAAESDSRLVRARIAATVAKTQLSRLKLGELDRSVVNRVEAIEQASGEIEELMAAIRSLPPEPLMVLGLTLEQARAAVDEFLGLLLADLGEPARELNDG